jgi:hypothetical protein
VHELRTDALTAFLTGLAALPARCLPAHLPECDAAAAARLAAQPLADTAQRLAAFARLRYRPTRLLRGMAPRADALADDAAHLKPPAATALAWALVRLDPHGVRFAPLVRAALRVVHEMPPAYELDDSALLQLHEVRATHVPNKTATIGCSNNEQRLKCVSRVATRALADVALLLHGVLAPGSFDIVVEDCAVTCSASVFDQPDEGMAH